MIDFAANVIKEQGNALINQAKLLSSSGFQDALDVLSSIKGKIIFTGVGKSGLIARKISSSFSSLGSPSFFVYPSEFQHGDFGVIQKEDCIIAISNSGNTEELFPLLEFIDKNNIKLIGITKNKDSRLGKSCHSLITLFYENENLKDIPAPTISTTLTLAIGDAMAICLSKMKGFSVNDYKKAHPGGAIGRDLLNKI